MKRNYKLLLVIVAICVGLKFYSKANEGNPERQITFRIIDLCYEHGHCEPAAIDDKFSRGYKDYIEALDPSKRFCNRILTNFNNMKLKLTIR